MLGAQVTQVTPSPTYLLLPGGAPDEPLLNKPLRDKLGNVENRVTCVTLQLHAGVAASR